MANEIVKYDNELNSVPFRRFNNREFNIFFSIISKLKEKGTRKIFLDFSELQHLSCYKGYRQKFIDDLDRIYTKMLDLKIWNKNEDVSEAWVLFTHYKIDKKNNEVSIAINPDMKGVLNSLANWTRFSLQQFVSLNSTYSKTAFRLLKQYRTVGKRNFSLQEFNTLFDIPKSYISSDIDRRVLQPIKTELAAYFKGLSVKKIRSHKRGRKIIGYSFTWKQETKNSDDFSKGEKRDMDNKIFNIKNNADLTKQEKDDAINKILNNKEKNNKVDNGKQGTNAFNTDTLLEEIDSMFK